MGDGAKFNHWMATEGPAATADERTLMAAAWRAALVAERGDMTAAEPPGECPHPLRCEEVCQLSCYASAPQASQPPQGAEPTDAMREVLQRCVAGIDHLSALARLWEPDHSSGSDRRGWVLAQDARDDARKLLAASPLPAPQEPARPDILEKLTYHQHERDDLTLDECWEVLASGYRKVHGRTDRQMVMQILALLAAAPSPQEPAAESVARWLADHDLIEEAEKVRALYAAPATDSTRGTP